MLHLHSKLWPLKIVNDFTYLIYEGDVNMRLAKVWTAIDGLLITLKFGLYDEIKVDLFRAVAVSVLLSGRTTRSLTKLTKKKLVGNCTRMLRAILNKYGGNIPRKNSCTDT